MRAKRAALTTIATGVLTAALSAGSAQAATINPTYWDFGVVSFGAQSAPKAFVTTGQAGDNFTAHPALLGFDPSEFKIVANDCSGKLINGPEDVCTVSVVFAPTDDGSVGDLSAILTIPGYGDPSADLVGHTEADEETGGRKRGDSGTTPDKCKNKKYRKKHKKKCKKKKKN